jgi:hypothetical protein
MNKKPYDLQLSDLNAKVIFYSFPGDDSSQGESRIGILKGWSNDSDKDRMIFLEEQGGFPISDLVEIFVVKD